MKTTENPQLKLAFDFVQYSGSNIFLTGKAGTGKTTFLHSLKNLSPKRMVVVAPTGVAAINAGGVTIHSFFQLSFGPQLPGYEEVIQDAGFKRFSKEKRNIIKSLDLLVIDEISMVRADILDGIDKTIRRFKNRNIPFGGVQLLMIGDLQQLAPVVKEDEWQLLRQHYDSAFFFSSKALKETLFISIELKHVYRQSDQRFINILNKIRDNQIDHYLISQLNERYIPGFAADDKGYITLTTHNAKAKNINVSRLEGITAKPKQFIADVHGIFPEYNFPTEYKLQLKTGAQVMFVKNDPSPDKLYFNGKIGKVTGFEYGHVMVKCPDDDYTIDVEPLVWQNVKYGLNRETREITEEIEGSFTQIPLKLAWAITIHKSQGLTFDRAIIDVQAAFAHGQVYVALSRCKSIEGLVLSSKINSLNIKSNASINQFTQEVEKNQPDNIILQQAKLIYQQQLLEDLFDFNTIQDQFYYINNLLTKNAYNLPVSLIDKYIRQSNSFKTQVVNTADKFKLQIKHLLRQNNNAERNPRLQERIRKAVVYFCKKLDEHVINIIQSTEIETDNKEIKRNISEALDKLLQEGVYKQTCLNACEKGFVLKDYLQIKSKASIEELPKKRKRKKFIPDTTSVSNAELYNLLKEWRDTKAKEMNWEVYMVLPLKTIRELCNKIPSNKKSLKDIKGFGKKKMEYFGDELLEILNDYRHINKMEILPPEDPVENSKKLKLDTKLLSYEFWKSGKKINEIAEERQLRESTIEGHLAYFVEKGEIKISDLVSEKLIKIISDQFLKSDSILLRDTKDQLGDLVSFGQLRLVLSHLIYSGKIKKPR